MSKRDELIEKYAADLQEKCGMKPDMELLTAVTKACGPSIYKKDSATVAASDKSELERVKQNFLIKKLGLADTPKLDDGIKAAIETYGKATRSKHRPVFYYLLAKHFKKGKAMKEAYA
ncbi:MAG: DUF2853 family protein [Pseudomonadota bacterium]